jgi:tRNA-specific 2-thiouridylase
MVALSGGVDSAVAASILKEQGFEVAGVTMCLGAGSMDTGNIRCCGPREIEDARAVCQALSMDHHVVDFASELERHVITPFVEEYRSGRTPNPCVECNRRIKFGVLLDMALSLGFDLLATGHYAAIGRKGQSTCLKRPADLKKDQTYFLAGVSGSSLERVVFPLADLTKDRVRALARDARLPVSSKPDSQDICFIPEGGIDEFLKGAIPEEPGEIVDCSGRVLGRHRGIAFYTVGQRSGLGISTGRPQYVLSLDRAHNRITVGDRRRLLSRGLRADSVNVFVRDLPARAWGKIRYAHRPAQCTACLERGELDVRFDEPQEAVTPGQTVVLYGDDVVLASGIIREAIP